MFIDSNAFLETMWFKFNKCGQAIAWVARLAVLALSIDRPTMYNSGMQYVNLYKLSTCNSFKCSYKCLTTVNHFKPTI